MPGESGWPDLNRRPPAPKAGALTKLRYSPNGGNRQVSLPSARGGERGPLVVSSGGDGYCNVPSTFSMALSSEMSSAKLSSEISTLRALE